MPEIRIRYEDTSDRMPYRVIAAIMEAAAQGLPVTGFEWVRDDDLPDKTVTIRPDTSGLEAALTEASIDDARRVPGVSFRLHRTGRGA